MSMSRLEERYKSLESKGIILKGLLNGLTPEKRNTTMRDVLNQHAGCGGGRGGTSLFQNGSEKAKRRVAIQEQVVAPIVISQVSN